eukprot:TRINITY_DN1739_c0_g3_i1.p1 TRINITY_DN1739_c0_g3~~TRINITY_DN1739_c0_g3_i1.p1  ORF type:complete len:215 (+),score=16.18 TRINITY_DN1739_c0_g3_i1:72-647(+)
MMAMQKPPTRAHFCGLPLIAAVNLVRFLIFVRSLMWLTVVSSRDVLTVAGCKIGPLAQVIVGTWALGGPPLVVCNFFAMIWNIPMFVRSIKRYWEITLLCDLALFLWGMTTGDLCSMVVDRGVRMQGPLIVCRAVSTMFALWMVVYFIWQVYLLHAFEAYCSLVESESEQKRLLPYHQVPSIRQSQTSRVK